MILCKLAARKYHPFPKYITIILQYHRKMIKSHKYSPASTQIIRLKYMIIYHQLQILLPVQIKLLLVLYKKCTIKQICNPRSLTPSQCSMKQPLRLPTHNLISIQFMREINAWQLMSHMIIVQFSRWHHLRPISVNDQRFTLLVPPMPHHKPRCEYTQQTSHRRCANGNSCNGAARQATVT